MKRLWMVIAILLATFVVACSGSGTSPLNQGGKSGCDVTKYNCNPLTAECDGTAAQCATPVPAPTKQPSTLAQVQVAPTASVLSTGTSAGGGNSGGSGSGGGTQGQAQAPGTDVSSCPTVFAKPGDINMMPKNLIEDVGSGKAQTKDVQAVGWNAWFHRVFDLGIFNKDNGYKGADSWFVTLALGPHSGIKWSSFGNTGEIKARADYSSTTYSWCLGVSTVNKAVINGQSVDLKAQTLSRDPSAPNVQMSFRIAHDERLFVASPTGTVTCGAGIDQKRDCKALSANAVDTQVSDQGDVTIVLPDCGVTYIWTTYKTEQQTYNADIHWGPLDHTDNINQVVIGNNPSGCPAGK